MNITDRVYIYLSMQESSDAAALAGAEFIVSNNITENIQKQSTTLEHEIQLIKNSLKTELLGQGFPGEDVQKIINSAVISIDSVNKDGILSYVIKVITSYKMIPYILKDFSQEYLNPLIIRVSSTALAQPVTSSGTEKVNPFSLQFVLDVSGSMSCAIDAPPELVTRDCKTEYPYLIYTSEKKINLIKDEVLSILTYLDHFDLFTYRVGSVEFSQYVVGESESSWTTDKLKYHIKNLTTYSFTNSFPAMSKAYNNLISVQEKGAHMSKHHLTYDKNIIFVTDGVNSYNPYYDSNQKTLEVCSKAKKDSIRIFIIMINPTIQGSNFLKKCVLSIQDYYEAPSRVDLEHAFNMIKSSMVSNPRVLLIH
ncbi:vWA domain-containing protein [Liberibacter crescens]|nr:vWA domain-containing protein [Liberibacter crescens]